MEESGSCSCPYCTGRSAGISLRKEAVIPFSIKSEQIDVLGKNGEVIYSVPGRLEHRFVFETLYGHVTAQEVISTVKREVLAEESGTSFNMSFEHVCSTCEKNPCYIFDYVPVIRQIGDHLKKKNMRNEEIKDKIFKHLAYRLDSSIPSCVSDLVEGYYPDDI